MIVVSNTSPLHYLVLIGEVETLARVFGEVLVPPEVITEILHPRAPEVVRRWAEAPPAWLKVVKPAATLLPPPGLGPGETQAIALAKERGAKWLLMDDRDATLFARREGLQVAGTLAVLEEAARRGLVDLTASLSRLGQTNFRCSPETIRRLLERHAARGPGQGPS